MSIYKLISRKYLLNNTQHNISIMIKICILSLVIASAGLALSIFIMEGFEKETTAALKSFNPEIIMQPYGSALNYEKAASVLSEFKEIESFSPVSNQFAIIKVDDCIDINNVVMVKGIDPKKEFLTTDLNKYITTPNLNLENQVIIGSKIANINAIKIGSKITLIFAKNVNGKIDFESKDAIVGGYIKTGIDEIDNSLIICSLDFLKDLSNCAQISQINIKPKVGTVKKDLIKKIYERFKIETFSWEDLYPAFVSTLKLEKYVAFGVLLFLILIASMNLISLLLMLITQKRKDIAILYSIGTSTKEIKKIFITISLIITFIGTSVGLGIATAIAYFIKWKNIQIPDVYYISHLPVEINIEIIFLILILSLLISAIFSYIPLKYIHRKDFNTLIKS